MSIAENRREQMFPVLSDADRELARRFASGPPQSFGPGEVLFALGARGTPAFLVVSGSIEVVRRDGLGHESIVTQHRAGEFSGEMSQLAGRAAVAEGRAGPDGCVAVPFDAAHLRALVIGSAELGETVNPGRSSCAGRP